MANLPRKNRHAHRPAQSRDFQLRILGPCRNLNQIELAYTDAVALGFEIPLRSSGDIKDTPGCMLMVRPDFLNAASVIRAKRHVHMHPTDAEFYGVKTANHMKLKIGGRAPSRWINCWCAWIRVLNWKCTLTRRRQRVQSGTHTPVELIK